MEATAGGKQFKQVPVAEIHIFSICGEVGAEWRHLGTILGLQSSLLDFIEIDNSTYREKTWEMLHGWKRENIKGATVGILINALEKIEKRDVAEKMRATARGKRFKQASVTEIHIKSICGEVGAEWRHLGTVLGLQSSLLDFVETGYSTYREKTWEMLQEWRRETGKGATVRILTKALEKIEKRDVAEKLREELGEKLDLSRYKGVGDRWGLLEKEIKKAAPIATVISCEKEHPDKPSHYAKKEFHGNMTRSEAEDLLSEAVDGAYFVRRSENLPGKCVLSIRHSNSNIKHFPLSYTNGIHCSGDLAVKNLEDLVNNILKSDHLNDYVDDFTAIHLKRTSFERNQIPDHPYQIPPSTKRKIESTMEVNGNGNAIERNAPKATKILCQIIPENKPSRFGNEFHGSLSREEAENIVSQHEDGHYLVRESISDNVSRFVLTFRFCGRFRHFVLRYYDKIHYVDGRGFTSLDDLANHCLTVLYQEMCAQNINQRVKGSYSETRVETSSDSHTHNEDIMIR